MSLAAFLSRFRELHGRSAAGSLSAEEGEEYRRARAELARALVAVQRLSLKPGETARQSLRVARALQVDLEWPRAQVRAATLDLSVGGFATLLAKAPSQADEGECVFRLPGGDKMTARAKVVNVAVQPTAVRVAFAFEGLPEEDRERVERVVFDTVLDQLGPGPPRRRDALARRPAARPGPARIRTYWATAWPLRSAADSRSEVM